MTAADPARKAKGALRGRGPGGMDLSDYPDPDRDHFSDPWERAEEARRRDRDSPIEED